MLGVIPLILIDDKGNGVLNWTVVAIDDSDCWARELNDISDIISLQDKGG